MSFLVRDSYKYLQEFFVRRYNVICEYDTHTNLKYTPLTFEEFVKEFHSAIEHGLRLLEEDNGSSSSPYDARVLRSYLQTKDELNLGVGLIYNCSSKELERGETPMIVENADDFIYHSSDDFDPTKAKAPPITHAVINLEDDYDRINAGLPPLDKTKSSDTYYPIKVNLYEALEQTLQGSISWCKSTNYPMDKTIELLISELQSRLKTLQK